MKSESLFIVVEFDGELLVIVNKGHLVEPEVAEKSLAAQSQLSLL